MPRNWKPIVAFFVLSLLLLALVPVLSLITGLTMDFDAAAASATEKTGIEQTSNLLVVVRMAIAEPALWLLILGSSVPALAAVLVCAWTRKPGPVFLLKRLFPVGDGAPWTQALRAYLWIFLLIPVALMTVFGLRQVIPGGTEYALSADIFGPALLLALLTAAFLDQGGVLEEIGWRGYAQPAIQAHLMTPLHAALLIGLLWGLWHVPRDVVGGTITRLGAMQYLFLFLPSFVLGTVTISIIAAYFMNRTGGSVLPAIMVHGLANDAVGLAGAANLNVALTPYHQITKALPFLVITVVLVAISGKQLGQAESKPD